MLQITGISGAHSKLDVEFPVAQNEITEAMTDLWRARETLKRVMALTRASSLQGALGQMALLYELVVNLVESIPDANVQTAVHGKEVAARRLIRSVIGVLKKATEEDAEAGKYAAEGVGAD